LSRASIPISSPSLYGLTIEIEVELDADISARVSFAFRFVEIIFSAKGRMAQESERFRKTIPGG